jgi:hypothetical protein
MMTEEFLHYLWKFRLINKDLQSRSGESIIVIHPGEHNHDGGPDFLNSRIRIGETTWAGNVEIHVDEGDWFRHRHHIDKAYENVILHVVFEDEEKFCNQFDYHLPVLILKGEFPENIQERYEDFLRNRSWIPCEYLARDCDPSHFIHWAPALLSERLESRVTQWEGELELNRYDWEETLHQCIARSFGLRINTLPFELLAKSLPLKIIRKYKNSQGSLEALAFGQAGMLNRCFSDDYPQELKKEYEFLAAKYSLKPIDPSMWKYLRLRPSSFPTIRIAQWAVLLQKADRLFSVILECRKPGDLFDFFSLIASGYWDNHFLFDRQAQGKPKMTGDSTIQLIIINAVAPFLFFYGLNKGIQDIRDKAIALIEGMDAENNSIITRWRHLGFPAGNALQTQALIQLKTNYCDRKRCLECRIGIKLLNL